MPEAAPYCDVPITVTLHGDEQERTEGAKPDATA